MSYDKNKIELKLYGLPHEEGGDVRADVFVRKLDTLLKGLRAADLQNSGQKTLDYLIKDMRYGSAYTCMSEFWQNSKKVPVGSAVQAFHNAIESVNDGRGLPQGTSPALAKVIHDIGSGCDKTFSHGEIGIAEHAESTIRVDVIFAKKADRAYKDFTKAENQSNFFEGTAFGTFEGKLKVIDLRGTVTSAKLILAIGGAELNCTCNSVTVENLKDALDQNVLVSGRAHYDGKAKLPEHIEIKKIEILRAEGIDFLRWNGAFDIPHPSNEDTW